MIFIYQNLYGACCSNGTGPHRGWGLCGANIHRLPERLARCNRHAPTSAGSLVPSQCGYRRRVWTVAGCQRGRNTPGRAYRRLCVSRRALLSSSRPRSRRDGNGRFDLAAFARAYGRPVVIINGAVSGASIEQLSANPLRRLQHDIVLAKRMGLRPALTIYMQGETDAARHSLARVYLAKLHALREALPGRWVVTLNSRCYDQPVWPALNVARAVLAATDPLVVIGPEMDSLHSEYRQDDGCHLNAAGQAIVGEALGRAVRGYL